MNNRSKYSGKIAIPDELPKLTVQFNPTSTTIRIRDSQDAFLIFKQYWDDSIYLQEKVYALFLNNARDLYGCKILASGSYKSCDFDQSYLYTLALSSRATKIIVAHNHTTGKIIPSDRDKVSTEKIKEGCELLGIQLIDHLIIGENCFFSFADHDLIL